MNRDKIFYIFKFTLFAFSIASITFILRFPYEDIKPKIVAFISQQTNNQVFVDFESLEFNFLPLGFKALQVEASFAPLFTKPIKAKSLRVRPNASILRLSPGGYLGSEIFGGDLSINGSQTGQDENGQPSFNLSIDASKIDLDQLTEELAPLFSRNFQSPLKLKGSTSIDGSIELDMGFSKQPYLNLEFSAKALKILSGSIATQAFPVDIPKLNLSSLELDAELENGKLRIKHLKLIGEKNQINGEIKGDINLRFSKAGRQIRSTIGDYELEIDMRISPQLYEELYFLRLAESFKSPGGGLDRYHLKVSGSGTKRPPNITRL